MATIMKHPSHHMISERVAVQKVCIAVGTAFALIGILGMILPSFMGFHLSMAHNLIHLLSAALALWCGYSENLKKAYNFCLGFGAFYSLLGIVGFIVGEPGYPSVGHMEADQYLLRIIPNVLEFGSNDHVLHLVLGGFLLFTAFKWRKQYSSPGAKIVKVQSSSSVERTTDVEKHL